MFKIVHFAGTYSFLSNFHPLDFYVRLDGEPYPTVEHAYQASKVLRSDMRQIIAQASTPGQTKRIARRMTQKFGLPPGFNDRRIAIMRPLVEQKFFYDPRLGELLKATGNRELVEGNTWGDTFWGQVDGVGENNLGKILMEVRSQL